MVAVNRICAFHNEIRTLCPISPSRELVTLDEAVVFDLLGQEDIVAIFCDTEFSCRCARWIDNGEENRSSRVQTGMSIATIQLRKEKVLLEGRSRLPPCSVGERRGFRCRAGKVRRRDRRQLARLAMSLLIRRGGRA